MCHTIETLTPPLDQTPMEIEFQDPDHNSSSSSSSVSDSESCVSGPADHLFHARLSMLSEDQDTAYSVIKQRFVSSLADPTVVAIHKKDWSSSSTAQPKAHTFHIHRRLMETRKPGNVNMKFAWFGTSRDGVDRIMSHGFGLREVDHNNGLYGRGVYLSPHGSPLDSVQSADEDEFGLRHVVLCRVLLGRMEVVQPCSDQTHPSSEEFDSGVDSLQSPKKYIVWSTKMNTHILPEYVVSFRALRNASREQIKKPTSPWMPFPALIQELAKFLPPPSVGLISQYHKDYKERRISRNQLVQHVRKAAGDNLLMTVIKSWRSKTPRAPLKKGQGRFGL